MTLGTPELHELLTFATAVVSDASELLREMRVESRSTMRKKSNATDIVTSADTAVGSFIVNAIKEQFPDDAILSEEGASHSSESGRRWIIDPLDGTLNYVRGSGGFGPILSLEVDGVPVVGAISDATTKQTWSAAKGLGATCNGEPINVSDVSHPEAAVLAIDGATDRDSQLLRLRMLNALTGRLGATRQIGSCAATFGVVAIGGFDAYVVNGAWRWDVSAGSLIVAEAGGRAQVYPLGRDSKGNERFACLATNALLFDRDSEIVSPILAPPTRSF